MDEDELVKVGMEVMLRPVTDIAENALGLLGGDWLSEKRARNRAKLKTKTEDILRARGIELDTDPSPSVIIPLLAAAQDEGREELQNLWASLLAAGSDPARVGAYRREFVDIAKELEPVDALILLATGATGRGSADDTRKFAANHSLTVDQLEISMDRLIKLELLSKGDWIGYRQLSATHLGREFFRTIKD